MILDLKIIYIVYSQNDLKHIYKQNLGLRFQYFAKN